MLIIDDIRVSVIIPAYNVEKYITRSINSALNQKYKPFEIIIIDDGSTDNTSKVIDTFKNDLVYLYQDNAGSSSARNLGIKNAKGNWIAFLDSDDEWIDTHLLNFVKTYHFKPTFKWYGAPFKMIDENTKEILFKVKKDHIRNDKLHVVFNDYMTAFPPKAYLSSPTMIIKKNVFDNIGLFDTNKQIAEDVDMWFRIALEYPRLGYSYKEGAIVYRRKLSLSTSKTWTPSQSINRFIECENLARNISSDALKRAEPRIAYWNHKLIKGAIRKGDIKTLNEIKKRFDKILSIKYRLILFLATNLTFWRKFVKSKTTL